MCNGGGSPLDSPDHKTKLNSMGGTNDLGLKKGWLCKLTATGSLKINSKFEFFNNVI